MATKYISCTAKHPYPLYRWELKYPGTNPETNEPYGWQVLSSETYQPTVTGLDTKQIGITDPQQGRDEAWFRCNVSNPVGNTVITDGLCYVSIGPLEWAVNLKAETKTVEETPTVLELGYLHDFTTRTLGGFTFSRSGTATEYSSDGTAVVVGDGQPAYTNLSTGAGHDVPTGIVVHPTTAAEILEQEDFDAAPWSTIRIEEAPGAGDTSYLGYPSTRLGMLDSTEDTVYMYYPIDMDLGETYVHRVIIKAHPYPNWHWIQIVTSNSHPDAQQRFNVHLPSGGIGNNDGIDIRARVNVTTRADVWTEVVWFDTPSVAGSTYWLLSLMDQDYDERNPAVPRTSAAFLDLASWACTKTYVPQHIPKTETEVSLTDLHLRLEDVDSLPDTLDNNFSIRVIYWPHATDFQQAGLDRRILNFSDDSGDNQLRVYLRGSSDDISIRLYREGVGNARLDIPAVIRPGYSVDLRIRMTPETGLDVYAINSQYGWYNRNDPVDMPNLTELALGGNPLGSTTGKTMGSFELIHIIDSALSNEDMEDWHRADNSR